MQPKNETATVVRALRVRARGPATLPKATKSCINQLSHKRAVLYEQNQCAAIMEQLQRLANQGTHMPELLAALEQLENADSQQTK